MHSSDSITQLRLNFPVLQNMPLKKISTNLCHLPWLAQIHSNCIWWYSMVTENCPLLTFLTNKSLDSPKVISETHGWLEVIKVEWSASIFTRGPSMQISTRGSKGIPFLKSQVCHYLTYKKVMSTTFRDKWGICTFIYTWLVFFSVNLMLSLQHPCGWRKGGCFHPSKSIRNVNSREEK